MKMIGRVVLIVLVLLLVFGLSRSKAQLFMFGNSQEGKPAADFTLSTLTQKAVTMSAYRGNAPAILFFWATWCPHCREALHDLNARASEIQAQGVKIVIVDVGEDRAQVKNYVDAHGITLEVFLDEDSLVAGDYMIVGVPTFLLINKDGIIKSVTHVLPQDYQTILTATAGQGNS